MTISQINNHDNVNLYSATCRKSLDSTNATEHDMQPYCKGCYSKSFGPSGYGFAGGAAGLSTTNGKSMSNGQRNGNRVAGGANGNKDDPENCPRCGKRVYFAEQLLSLNRKWHKLCFKCGESPIILVCSYDV